MGDNEFSAEPMDESLVDNSADKIDMSLGQCGVLFSFRRKSGNNHLTRCTAQHALPFFCCSGLFVLFRVVCVVRLNVFLFVLRI